MGVSSLFRPVGFAELPGWAEDDHLAAFAALRRSAFRARTRPYRTGALGVEAAPFTIGIPASLIRIKEIVPQPER